MARLVIVAGASGAGKTFLLNGIKHLRNDIQPIKKLTTRPARPNEPKNFALDLIFDCTATLVRNCDYVYTYCSHTYGFNKSDIEVALRKNLSPIVIIASCNTIETLKKDYNNALVLYVQTIISGDDLKKQLIKYNDPMSVDERMRRQDYSLRDYVKYFDKKIFDYVLLNDFSDDFMSQIQYIYEKENDESDSNYVFVIMSFKKEYNDVYEAFVLAGKSIANNSIKIERIDSKRGGYVITDKIDACIKKAGLIICDISENSPNVYYELGYSRAKEKSIIMTAKKGTELPFDVRQYHTVFYDKTMELQKEIISELKEHFKL